MKLSAVIGLALVCSLPAVARAATPKPADGFVDSIGVNTHLGYLDTAYGATDTVILPRIQELGIRHLRDKMQAGNAVLQGIQKRLAERGVRFMLVTPIDMTPDSIGAWLKAVGPSAVSAVEGPNEYDLSGDPNWVSALQAHTHELWALIKNDVQLAGINVAGPSLVDWKVDSYPALGDQSAFMDLGNFHWYYAGWPPSASGAEHKKLKIIIDRYRPVTGDKPMIISECGYHDAIVYPPQHYRAPDAVAAKYVPEMFLFHYGYGLVRSFSYELIDEFDDPTNHEGNFGLLKSDGQPKAAFTSLKNLIALLADAGPAFQPEALDFTLEGDTADVQTVLLQKRNGDFYLAIWSGKPIWQPIEEVMLNPAPQAVQLRFATPVRGIQQVRPNQTVAWQDVAFTGDPLQVNADGELQLFRIVPQVTKLSSQPNPSTGGGGGGEAGAGSSAGAFVGDAGSSSMGAPPSSGGIANAAGGGVATGGNSVPGNAAASNVPQAPAGCGCRYPGREGPPNTPFSLAIAVLVGWGIRARRAYTRKGAI